jgi:predicted XRE-type DNA-binding protein
MTLELQHLRKIGHTTAANISVLEDLNLDGGFIVKAKLAIRIQKTVQEMGLNQRDAARQMGISQPKLSQLTRGKFDGPSQAKLEECLVALGHDVIINIGPRHAGVGLRRVEERAFG